MAEPIDKSFLTLENFKVSVLKLLVNSFYSAILHNFELLASVNYGLFKRLVGITASDVIYAFLILQVTLSYLSSRPFPNFRIITWWGIKIFRNILLIMVLDLDVLDFQSSFEIIQRLDCSNIDVLSIHLKFLTK